MAHRTNSLLDDWLHSSILLAGLALEGMKKALRYLVADFR
jgi:hypothetical protein